MRRHGWVAWVRKPPKGVPVDQPRHHFEDLLLRASPRSDLCVWVPKFGAKGNRASWYRWDGTNDLVDPSSSSSVPPLHTPYRPTILTPQRNFSRLSNYSATNLDTHLITNMVTSKFTEMLDDCAPPSLPSANVTLEDCLEHRQRSPSSSSSSKGSIEGVKFAASTHSPPATPTSPISGLMRAFSTRRRNNAP
ncbi:hypothetical protein KCV04_g17270, partial [Aureobasidium melanogenum]